MNNLLSKKMKAVVLTAGKSTRILPISRGLPKPLLKIGGRSVIERNLEWLESFGFKDIWFNLHYRSEEVKNYLTNINNSGLNINFSYEPNILGTAGAVKKLEKKWDKSFLVVYGDNLLNFDLNDLIKAHVSTGTIATIALFNIKKHLNSGIAGGRVRINNRYVADFIEGESNYDLVNAGCYICEPSICDYIPSNIFYDFAKDLFPLLFKNDINLGAHIIKGYCLGLDDPCSYAKVEKIVKEKEII